MRVAVCVLVCSLDKGVHQEFVQFETFRKLQSVATNVFQAGVGGLSNTIGAYERQRMWISKVPTHLFWFTRFMGGIHKRVGDLRVQDKAVTLEVMKKVGNLVDSLWRAVAGMAGIVVEGKWTRLRIAKMGAWFHIGFCL